MATLRDRHVLTRRGFAAGLALAPMAVSGASHQAAARQGSPAVDALVFRYTFGDADVCVFDTETWPTSVNFGASNATSEERKAITKEHGTFTMSVNATVVDTRDHLIVVDAGPDYLLAGRMVDAGYDPNDVDIVTFSHLHFDHVDGAFFAERRELAFPNARHYISTAEYEYMTHEDERPVSDYAEPNMGIVRADAERIISSLGDTLELLEWGEEIVPGVKLVEAIGHTGGHSAVEITSADESWLHVGDLMINPILNLEHPDWVIAPAVWPEEDLATRRVLMDRAADEHLLVQTVHFPFPGVGYVEHDGDAWNWIPLACGAGCEIQARNGG